MDHDRLKVAVGFENGISCIQPIFHKVFYPRALLLTWIRDIVEKSSEFSLVHLKFHWKIST